LNEPGPSTWNDGETYLGQAGFGVKIAKATLNKITQTAKDAVPFFLRLVDVMFSKKLKLTVMSKARKGVVHSTQKCWQQLKVIMLL